MTPETISSREAILRRARRIVLSSRRVVARALAGETRSVFRGTGVEFDSVREYAYGDDVRAIDWNVTARAGRPFVKRFVTTRERDVVLAVDRSGSMSFATARRTKAEIVAELAAILASIAERGRERVGLVEFGNREPQELAPRRNRALLERIVGRLLEPTRSRVDAGFDDLVARIERVLPRRALLFLVSDFHELPGERLLARLAARHETIAVRVFDPREIELRGDGAVSCVDPETGRAFAIDAAASASRARFAADAAARSERLRALCGRAGVGRIDLDTRDERFRALFDFFESRRRGGVA